MKAVYANYAKALGIVFVQGDDPHNDKAKAEAEAAAIDALIAAATQLNTATG